MRNHLAIMLSVGTLLLSATQVQAADIDLRFMGRYSTGLFNAGAAEIPAHDPVTQRLFVVNLVDTAIDVLDISNPANPNKIGAIDVSPYGASANSVAVRNGVLAVAIESSPKTAPGVVAFFNTSSFGLISQVPVGSLPDMLTFTKGGTYVVVANEGEPSADYLTDPEGSISIISVTDINNPTVRTAGFTRFNSQKASLMVAGVRIFGPNATVAQDLEPEYITTGSSEKTAFVTLQENNALAVVNLDLAKVTRITPLGFKDHSQLGSGLDASDRDSASNGGINISQWPLRGMYMPDTIASYVVGGQTYVVTANEGDARDYSGFAEEARVKTLTLDPVAFPDAANLQTDAQLGRLTVTTALGDTDGDGDYDELYAFGGRSFSIWNAAGSLVWDSGDDFEQITSNLLPANFNSEHTANTKDTRSDNKGPEPEGLTLAKIGGRTFAFIGLERMGGIMVYDITDPTGPVFVSYANTRDYSQDPAVNLAGAGDLGPEGLLYIPATESPNGKHLLVVASEVSGTTTIFQVKKNFPTIQ